MRSRVLLARALPKSCAAEYYLYIREREKGGVWVLGHDRKQRVGATEDDRPKKIGATEE